MMLPGPPDLKNQNLWEPGPGTYIAKTSHMTLQHPGVLGTPGHHEHPRKASQAPHPCSHRIQRNEGKTRSSKNEWTNRQSIFILKMGCLGQ